MPNRCKRDAEMPPTYQHDQKDGQGNDGERPPQSGDQLSEVGDDPGDLTLGIKPQCGTRVPVSGVVPGWVRGDDRVCEFVDGGGFKDLSCGVQWYARRWRITLPVNVAGILFQNFPPVTEPAGLPKGQVV